MASHCHSHPLSFPLMPLSCIIFLLISLNMTPYANSFNYFSSCSNRFSCGIVTNVGFPFGGDGRDEWCGYPGLHLSCKSSLTYITINNITYLVKEVRPESHTLKIARAEFSKGLCPDRIQSTRLDILDHNLFDYIPGYQNLTLFYGCDGGIASKSPAYFICPVYGAADKYAYPLLGVGPPIPECTYRVVVPISSKFTVVDSANFKAIGKTVEDGFEVKWTVGIEECDQCQQSGGVCGYDDYLNQTTCYCRGSDSGSRICRPLPDAEAKAPQGMSC